jgi:NTE family protein
LFQSAHCANIEGAHMVRLENKPMLCSPRSAVLSLARRFAARALPLLAAVLCWSGAWRANAAEPEVPAPPETGAPESATPERIRPKTALVLSGGGARGLAHIGVLKVLRDFRIPIDLIVATSMGSIVGGAYAAGRTPEEMEELVRGADWETMFSHRPPRESLSFRRKEDDRRFIGQTEFGIGKDGLILPRGAFGTYNLEEFLRIVARSGSETRHLDELPIPFRAVATDLVTGELVILSDVPLSIAMRASMSVPGVFAPTNVDGRLLGDGGLTRNLPVEVARELGAEVIIAVNVGTPLLPREGLSSALGVAQQMINILTEQNVGMSLRTLTPADILISPDLHDVTFFDFARSAEIVTRGEAVGREFAARLAALSVDGVAYAAWEARRLRNPAAVTGPIAAVVTEGMARTNPAALTREVKERAGIEAGRPVSDQQLIDAARVLYGTGEFERVDVRTDVQNGTPVVVLDVDEKPWGPNYLRLVGYAFGDFRTESRFSITAQHTRTWVNSWGAEWRNEVQLGSTRRFSTSFYQPLAPGSPWFVEPLVQYEQTDVDLFGPGTQRTDRVTIGRWDLLANVGRRLGNIAVARIGLGRELDRTTPAISSRLEGASKQSGTYARFGGSVDTLDDANFPRHGYLFEGNATRVLYGSGDSRDVDTYVLSLLTAATVGRLSFLESIFAGRSRDDRSAFSLGGFLNMTGTPAGSIVGSQAALVSVIAFYRMGDLPPALGRGWYAGASIEVGNVWARRSDVGFGDLRKAGALVFGFDTVAGPLYLAWGHTHHGHSSVIVLLGGPSQRN